MRRSEQARADDALLRDGARRFLDDTYAWSPGRAGGEAHWRAVAGLGWFALALPEELDGAGADAAQALIVLEEAGRVLHDAPLAANVLLAPAVLKAMPPDVARPLAAALQAGEARFACLPDRGLRLADGGRTLSGSTGLAPGAQEATHWIVPVSSASPNGAALLLLPATTAATRDATTLIDGRRAAALAFCDAPMPPDALVARGEEAFTLAGWLADAAVVAAGADALGAAEAGLALTVDYLKQRRQFGAPLSSFQAVQHKMAESYCDIAQMRSLLAWAAGALDGPASADERAAAASALKAHLGQAGLRAVARMIQVSGGIGVTEDYRIGRVYKRLQTHAALSGSTEAHLARLGALVAA